MRSFIINTLHQWLLSGWSSQGGWERRGT